MTGNPRGLRRSFGLAGPGAVLMLALGAWGFGTHSAAAQEAASLAPSAVPEDVATADAIITAVYDVISGPVGEPRDWDRFRSLFIPGARLIPTGRNASGGISHNVLTVEDYIANARESLTAIGFREREIGRRTEAFGAVLHAFSSYEAFRGDETEPFMRGVNSFQLLNDGERWWIVTIFWSPEYPDQPIPARYLDG